MKLCELFTFHLEDLSSFFRAPAVVKVKQWPCSACPRCIVWCRRIFAGGSRVLDAGGLASLPELLLQYLLIVRSY